MTRELLMEMIARQLGLSPEQISGEASITEDLGADSLDIVELLAALEDEYGVYLTDEEVINLRTVDEVAACVLGRLSTEPSPEDWNENNE